jgi:hypothetical protein
MHNAWMRYISGKLKSDYRYSAGIAYNNYPWPSLAVTSSKTLKPKKLSKPQHKQC